MKTAVVILNWNTKGYLRSFLPSLIKSTEGLDAQIIVADSSSSDGSLDMLANEFPGVGTIPLDRNYGFTGGYNRALGGMDAQYYVLINSDIQVSTDWLRHLENWMDTHPDCAACAPKLHALVGENGNYEASDRFEYAGAAGGYIDKYGFPFCRGRVLKRTQEDTGQYDIAREVLWATGACLMVRASAWKELGGLDERFFAHMEEIDFCWRANRAGWKVCVVPQALVWHLGGGTLPSTSPFKLQLNYRNNLLLLEKNLPRDVAKKIFRRRYILDLCAAAAYFLTGKFQYGKAVLKAHREFKALSTGFGNSSSDRVPGYWNICILPLSFLKGEKIFEYLKAYEDNH